MNYKLKNISKTTWILLTIIVIGIFLRVYHFSDFLQFSPDQARDALIISDALNGKAPLPLSGPQAGNTSFSVGPLYYETQYLSARIFGNTPQALAYPDLFFSILSIPLLYFFLKKYFSIEISLILTALFSLSYFAIVNSRFASNPNTIPFFVLLFLYAILEIMQTKENKKLFFWYTLCGLSLGVGIQLHTILVFTMPVLLFVVLIWLLKNRLFNFKGFLFLLFGFLLINFGQLRYEMQTGGGNTKALFGSVLSRSDSGGNLFRNITLITSCQLESNIHFVSSLENKKDCGELFYLKGLKKKNISAFDIIKKNISKLTAMLVGIIFTVGGYIFLWLSFRKETNKNRRNFIWTLLFYNLVSFLVLIPVATEVELRYFNVLNMLPFVFLGVWLMTLLKQKNVGKIGATILISILLISNIYIVKGFAVGYLNGQISDEQNSLLGEIEPAAKYIFDNKNESQIVFLFGGRKYTKRFLKPLYYLLQKNGIELINGNDSDKKNILLGEKIFHIDKNLGNKYSVGKKVDDFFVEDIYSLNDDVKIYLLRK